MSGEHDPVTADYIPTPAFLRPTEVSLQYRIYNGSATDFPISYIPFDALTKELNFNLNFDIWRYFYSKNVIHTQMDSTNFKTIGWEYNLGVRITPAVELSIYHYSEHILDGSVPQWTNTQKTGIEIKINIFQDVKRRSIF